jgi:hypothetical protein
MDAALPIAMRWVHIASAIVLLGGMFYARVVVGDLAAGFKPIGYWAIGGILASGIYNFLSKNSPPPNYQLWLGIKVLLALHVFAVMILHRGVISQYLRWISLE